MNNQKPVIFGCSGSSLTDEERSFFKEIKPLGLILFDRNCHNPKQVSQLTEEFQEVVGEKTFVLIDQEGGRVMRMKPPYWDPFPCPRDFGDLFEKDREQGIWAAGTCAQLIGQQIAASGVNVNCIPLLDLYFDYTHKIIGRRSFGAEVETVVQLAKAMCQGSMNSGVLPVIKHLPGHGRATADSHEQLPTVDIERSELEKTDFVPFRALNDMPMGMTAHILYPQIDPADPATTSPKIIKDIVRGHIGFDGLLMSDDLSMGALKGSFSERTKKVLSAGCDLILHCNGDMTEMQEIATELAECTEEQNRRIDNAWAAYPTRVLLTQSEQAELRKQMYSVLDQFDII